MLLKPRKHKKMRIETDPKTGKKIFIIPDKFDPENLTPGLEVFGVVYQQEDGSIAAVDRLEAQDYWGACEKALKQSRGSEFQIITRDDCTVPLETAERQYIVAAAKRLMAQRLLEQFGNV